MTPEEMRDTFEYLEDSQDVATYFAGGEDRNNLHNDLHVRNEENRQAQFDAEVGISGLNVEIPFTPQQEVQNEKPQGENSAPSKSQQQAENNPPAEELEELRNLTTQELLLRLHG